MKQEKKIYYETILKERKSELIDLIHKYKIIKILIRRAKNSYAVIESKECYFIYVFKSSNSVNLQHIANLFEMKLLNCDINNKENIEDAFIIFCRYFQKLIKEVSND